MARKVPRRWRERPPEIKAALGNRLTTNVAFGRMKKKGIKPIIPLSEIRNIIKRKSRSHNVPISLSIKEFSRNVGHPKLTHADGVSVIRKNRVRVYIHPITQYYPKKHTIDIIDHELDHARVDKRIIKNRLKRILKKKTRGKN